jgi:hypothetical protein
VILSEATKLLRRRARTASPAQIRALRLAAEEGALDFYQCKCCPTYGRWAQPSRVNATSPHLHLLKPYEQSGTIFALERRGLLAPDPRYRRAQLGNRPRPRVITEAGRALLKRLDAKLITQLNRAWAGK